MQVRTRIQEDGCCTLPTGTVLTGKNSELLRRELSLLFPSKTGWAEEARECLKPWGTILVGSVLFWTVLNSQSLHHCAWQEATGS